MSQKFHVIISGEGQDVEIEDVLTVLETEFDHVIVEEVEMPDDMKRQGTFVGSSEADDTPETITDITRSETFDKDDDK